MVKTGEESLVCTVFYSRHCPEGRSVPIIFFSYHVHLLEMVFLTINVLHTLHFVMQSCFNFFYYFVI